MDVGRFWPADRLHGALVKCGFAVDLTVGVAVRPLDYREAIAEAENRDMSQLNMISETDYQDGLSKLREDARQNRERYIDVPVLTARCVKT